MSGAVLQMFSHGIMTASLRGGRRHLRSYAHPRHHGAGRPGEAHGGDRGVLAVAGLTSLGLPGLSGFVAELLVFLGLFQTYPVSASLGIIGAAITAVYILRLLAKVFFGPLGEQWQTQTDASPVSALQPLCWSGSSCWWGCSRFPS